MLLGEGIPLLPSPAKRATLTLTNRRTHEKTRIVRLEYDVLTA